MITIVYLLRSALFTFDEICHRRLHLAVLAVSGFKLTAHFESSLQSSLADGLHQKEATASRSDGTRIRSNESRQTCNRQSRQLGAVGALAEPGAQLDLLGRIWARSQLT